MKNNYKKIQSLFNEDNKTKLIGLLTVLVFIWLNFYFIPNIFVSLFTTLLGNLILVLIAILVSMYNTKYGILTSIILIILYRFSRLSMTTVEGFKWDEKTTQDFLSIQRSINPNKVFDVNMIQNTHQGTQQEVDYFINHGEWPWSPMTIELYRESLKSNPYIRNYSEDLIKYARTIYNESAILRIISYQTKEGLFLLNGVLVPDPSGNKYDELPSGFGDFPYKSGLIDDKRFDVIKCNTRDSGNATLERIRYTGKSGIYDEQTRYVSPVDYNNLESIIPGFTFLSEPCNPCRAINETPDYSCPFKLQVKNKSPFISNVWQYLWNINDNPLISNP